MTRLYLIASVVYDAPDTLYGTDNPQVKASMDFKNFTEDPRLMWDTLESGGLIFDVGVVPEDRCLPIIGHHVRPHIGCPFR